MRGRQNNDGKTNMRADWVDRTHTIVHFRASIPENDSHLVGHSPCGGVREEVMFIPGSGNR